MWGKGKQNRTEINNQSSKLSDLKSGDKAKIIEIGGSEQFRIRLMEMGLLIDDVVKMEKLAPLQDPIEFIIKGYHLTLRRKDAEKIAVEILSNEIES